MVFAVSIPNNIQIRRSNIVNKTIFQMGLLTFFVSIVGFSLTGGSVLDIVTRAFIVFVGATCLMGIIGFLWVTMKTQPRHEPHKQQATEVKHS